MLLVAALAPFVVLATTVVANLIAIRNSPISLPITKQINLNGTFLHPGRRYQKRWTNPVTGRQRSTSEVIDVPLANFDVVNYFANIGVGDPPTYCKSCRFLPAIVSYIPILDNLIVDTGSSNTWLGANNPYNVTKTSVKTDDVFVSAVSFHADSWLNSN